MRARLVALGIAALVAGCVAPPGGDAVRTDTVVIPGAWVFEPASVVAAVGSTVTWRNDGGQAHTVTFEGLGVDLVVAPGASVAESFEQAGTFAYACRYHPPDMRGVVVVEALAAQERP